MLIGMNKINIITIFPDFFNSFINSGLIGKACEKGILNINIVDLREFGKGNYSPVDDYCYGTGKSMVMKYDVFYNCLKSFDSGYKVILSPKGRKFNQKIAEEFSLKENITLFCGRYEGFDGRIFEDVDDVISVGDYVLNGGETASLCVIESMARLIDGFSKTDILKEDSFNDNLLEGYSYTRPDEFNEKKVPDILLNGNHNMINRYIRKNSLELTMKIRKDLFNDIILKDDDIQMLTEIINEKCHINTSS
ncbi:MAG: tRNA (guanosine(37)-N1)-methyltransferase TrmD [Candidatus Muirbacterium halophilum]|nr:tRNA (guanosine(37)-N1)-methyltransferase TrmD [Candidatus Muirbacterium halophilum]